MDKPIRRSAALAELEQARAALADERQRGARLTKASLRLTERVRQILPSIGMGLLVSLESGRKIEAAVAEVERAALAGEERAGESTEPYYRALIWDENGTTYRVGEGQPRPVTAWNVRLWFEDGDSTHFHTDAPKRRRQR